MFMYFGELFENIKMETYDQKKGQLDFRMYVFKRFWTNQA